MVFRPQQYLDKVTAALNLHITFDPLLILLYRGLVYASLTGSQVCDHLQYKPAKWRGRAHHPDVYAKFVRLYDYRIMTFLREMASVLLVPPPLLFFSISLSTRAAMFLARCVALTQHQAPFMLLFSLPRSAEAIIRFFHDFTVEYPGVGTPSSRLCFSTICDLFCLQDTCAPSPLSAYASTVTPRFVLFLSPPQST
jgi:hypothetical protein